jgi:hypothetical protein
MFKMAQEEGLEPSTAVLTAPISTIELLLILKWSGRHASNVLISNSQGWRLVLFDFYPIKFALHSATQIRYTENMTKKISKTTIMTVAQYAAAFLVIYAVVWFFGEVIMR